MTERKLYSDLILIESFLKQLVLVEKLQDGWAEKYIDRSSGVEWLLYYTNAEYSGGGEMHLIRLPEPTTTELIEIALYSNFEDESLAAAVRLRDKERYLQEEFRLELINQLQTFAQQEHSVELRSRIKKIITYSELNHPENRRGILGKKMEEIKADSLYFQRIAEEAQCLLDIL